SEQAENRHFLKRSFKAAFLLHIEVFRRFKMRNICIFIFLLLIFHLVCVQLSGLRQRHYSYYDDMKTWREAQSICREKHVDLITIRNETENQAFSKYHGWLGLYRDNNTSPWKWSRKDKGATFFKWDDNEPQSNQHCAFKVRTSSQWRNGYCNHENAFMCYDETLILVEENKTWEEALKHCRNLTKMKSYDLATLTSSDDHNYARKRAKKATTDEVWTGLRYMGDEWFWMGGEQVLYRDIPSCPADRCGVLEKNSNTSFEIRNCSERRNFFCYIKP
ncbi:hypothetical protein AMECASPLE_024436, partial [Ameca splendens]